VEFERWRGVGYPSPSRRACEAGFGEVLEAAVHILVHRTEHRTNVSCPVAIVRCKGALWRELRLKQRRREHRTEGHRTELPVRSFVRCVQLSVKQLGLATGQKRHVTRHVRCLSSTSVRCFAPLCLARPRASLHRTVATGQHLSVRCSVRCSSEHFSQLLSPPLLTTTNTKVFHHLVHVC